jgi:hypothetical protein
MLQFLQRSEEIGHGPAPAVQPPHQNNVDFTPARRLKEFLAGLPLCCTRANLANLHSNRPTAVISVFMHRSYLHRKCLLFIRGHARIQTNPKHFRSAA